LSRSTYLPVLASSGGSTKTRRLHDAVVDDIRRGRLRSGERLPGSRTLAQRLGLARTTVVDVVDELVAEGWLTSVAGAGVYVCRDLPEPPPLSTVPPRPGVDVEPVVLRRRVDPADDAAHDILPMGGGIPDLRQLPTTTLARALRTALQRQPHQLLGYGDPKGEQVLRQALARMLRQRRGVAATVDDVVVTRGAQQALYLLGQVLLRPGDRVGVECLGYPPAWDAFNTAGAELVPLPVDDDGLVVDALDDVTDGGRRPLRAVYTTPHHQFPTLVTLSAARRLRLLAWARRHRVAIIEDDYDHELHFEGQPTRPLLASDDAGVVVYVGSMSKAFAPALRQGFVVGPRAVLDAVAQLRQVVDRQGDRVGERAMAELLDEGDVHRHLRKMTQLFRHRRHLLLELLQQELADDVEVRAARGGMTVWAHLHRRPRRRAVQDLIDIAAAEGVRVTAASSLHVKGADLPFLRIGFAAVDDEEIRRGVWRLRQAVDRWRSAAGSTR